MEIRAGTPKGLPITEPIVPGSAGSTNPEGGAGRIRSDPRSGGGSPHSGLKEAIMSELRVFGMSTEWLIGLGALVTVAGVIFTLQGLGYIGGSVMTGVTLWAVVGPIAAVIGLTMAIAGLRRRRAA